MRSNISRAALMFGLLLSSCGNQSGTLPEGDPFDQIAGQSGLPTMSPGSSCLVCHVNNGLATDRPWSVAGTVFGSPSSGLDGGVSGASILLTDSHGKQITLISNVAGNFYTGESFANLVDVEVQLGNQRLTMTLADGGVSLATISDCNRCHQLSGSPGASGPLGVAGAPGELFVPLK
jgi:hypothetical protein